MVTVTHLFTISSECQKKIVMNLTLAILVKSIQCLVLITFYSPLVKKGLAEHMTPDTGQIKIGSSLLHTHSPCEDITSHAGPRGGCCTPEPSGPAGGVVWEADCVVSMGWGGPWFPWEDMTCLNNFSS